MKKGAKKGVEGVEEDGGVPTIAATKSTCDANASPTPKLSLQKTPTTESNGSFTCFKPTSIIYKANALKTTCVVC